MELEKSNRTGDRELGMHRIISRRDFLNGIAVGVGGLLVSQPLSALLASQEFAPEKEADYYPPARMGMRGNHDGSFAYAHRLRDGEPVVDSKNVPVLQHARTGGAGAAAGESAPLPAHHRRGRLGRPRRQLRRPRRRGAQNSHRLRHQHRFQMRQQCVQAPNVSNQPEAENEIETGIRRLEVEYVRMNEFELDVGNL